jgi:hypothetical protein
VAAQRRCRCGDERRRRNGIGKNLRARSIGRGTICGRCASPQRRHHAGCGYAIEQGLSIRRGVGRRIDGCPGRCCARRQAGRPAAGAACACRTGRGGGTRTAWTVPARGTVGWVRGGRLGSCRRRRRAGHRRPIAGRRQLPAA